jgi:putative transposase
MPGARYIWRRLTPEQRKELMASRRERHHAWHRPPHRSAAIPLSYHITAACYEHAPFIGHSPERMDSMSSELLTAFETNECRVHAWCVLPNHYHALITTDKVLDVLKSLAKMHGRLSFRWNGEENTRGRQVWCGAVEREMRGERHFWATMNYVHHNPVKHNYVDRWNDWPYSSAPEYLASVSREEAESIWREYPVLDYGAGWDDAEV